MMLTPSYTDFTALIDSLVQIEVPEQECAIVRSGLMGAWEGLVRDLTLEQTLWISGKLFRAAGGAVCLPAGGPPDAASVSETKYGSGAVARGSQRRCASFGHAAQHYDSQGENQQ